MSHTAIRPSTRILRIIDPTAPVPIATGGQRTLAGVSGKVLGVTANGWGSWAGIRADYVRFLTSERGVRQTHSWDVPLGSRAGAAILAEIAETCDAVVVGLANCGSCAVTTAANCNDLVEAGIAVVAVATQRFERLLASLAPSLPLVVLPANLEQLDEEQIRELQPELFAQIEAKLTASAP